MSGDDSIALADRYARLAASALGNGIVYLRLAASYYRLAGAECDAEALSDVADTIDKLLYSGVS